MNNPTMFYKFPGKHELHGGKFDYIIIEGDDSSEVERAIKEGWAKTTDEAKALSLPKETPKKKLDLK